MGKYPELKIEAINSSHRSNYESNFLIWNVGQVDNIDRHKKVIAIKDLHELCLKLDHLHVKSCIQLNAQLGSVNTPFSIG